MGMFDSFYDAEGKEWQTKALHRLLNRYTIGDTVPTPLPTCQIGVLGGGVFGGPFIDSYATVKNGVLTAVPAERDDSMMLVDYSGTVAT